jgi:hypothetical protein
MNTETSGTRRIFHTLEQVQVRFMVCRGLRLDFVLGVVFALAMPALAAAAGNSPRQDSQTALTAETRDRNGQTQASLEVSVIGEDGLPATGAVTIEDGSRDLAGAALNSQGHAVFSVDLPTGEHSLRAAYLGDDTHLGSKSQTASVHGQASSTPGFSISVSPASLTLPLGQSGSVIAFIKPENNSTLTAPMFVTLSCQGLPDESSCTFTPENIEILASSCPNPSASTCALKSTMVLETQLGTGLLARPRARFGAGEVNWALLLPGVLGLVGLGWRRRGWLGRLSALILFGVVSIAGTTACNARYNYFHHGPPANPATPAGTYTLTITAQSNNGITATTHTTTMVLTVQ